MVFFAVVVKNTFACPFRPAGWLKKHDDIFPADNAYVVVWSDMELVAVKEKKEGYATCSADKEYAEADLLPYCRFYDPGKPQDKQDLMGFYEFMWMQSMMTDKAYISQIVADYIYHNLETFNLDDGVPISLKALLFNRYAHWESYFTPEGFKKWYKSAYLNEE